MPEPCRICRTQPGPVCDADRKTIDQQLAALPARIAAAAVALTPGPAPIGEHISRSARPHTQPPAPVDWLSLNGPGGDVPATLRPMVRHWSIERTVVVTSHPGGRARTATVQVTDWFHELVLGDDGKPVMAADTDTDQVGVVPPREWLDIQVRRWRAHFGHHVPPRTSLGGLRPYVPAAWRWLLGFSNGPQAIALLSVLHQDDARRGGMARLAYRGLLAEPGARPLTDPVLEEIERRGEPGLPPRTVRWDVDYLRNWLDKACEQDSLDIPAFAAQLRALHAEISRVLGDTPDQTWVGRCPAFIAELDRQTGEPTGRKRPCGGGLWRETGAYLSAQVTCPRCHMTWDVCGNAGAGTAREIRRVWPLDRRRRYKAADIDRLTPPKCPCCGNRVTVDWREVTGTRDPARTWTPTRTSCPNGCEEARRLI